MGSVNDELRLAASTILLRGGYLPQGGVVLPATRSGGGRRGIREEEISHMQAKGKIKSTGMKAKAIKPAATKSARVKNPTGRVDWLTARLLDASVARYGSPLLKAAYPTFQPMVEDVLFRYLNPRRKYVKAITQGVRLMVQHSQRNGIGGTPCF